MTGRTVDGTRGEDIQRAIDSLGSGGVVQLSAGTYQLSAALRLPSGVAVVGEGPARTRLELLPASNGHMFVNADPTAGDVGIELRGLSFDGNMAAQQRPREKALSDAFGAFFSNVREVTIADVHAFRICQSAFQFNDCSQVDVTGVRIREVGWGGIARQSI